MVANAIQSIGPAGSTIAQVSSILNAIAPLLWPIIVGVAIYIFRAPLAAAIGRVSEVDVGAAKPKTVSAATATSFVSAAGDLARMISKAS